MVGMSPWLDVPLSDYERHMDRAEVGQYAVLSDIFRDMLAQHRPSSVAIVGVAGGNGLEHIHSGVTTRTVGLDINPAYLDEVRRRFPDLPGLELYAVDLARSDVHIPAVDLVHAALILEHAGCDRCLRNTLALVQPNGLLSVVLQLPSEQTAGVAPTPYESIRALSPHFRLIEPAHFDEAVARHGFERISETRHELPGGKAFHAAVYRQTSIER